MEITLEKIELVKDRTGVTYAEAKEALEEADGSVVDAIIAIEETINAGEKGRGFGKKGEDLFKSIKDLIKKGNVSKIQVKKDGELILNVPVNAGIVGVVIAPLASVVAVAAAFGFKCVIEVIKDDGTIIDVSDAVTDAMGTVAEKSSSVASEVKEMSADLYQKGKEKGSELYQKSREMAEEAVNKIKKDDEEYDFSQCFNEEQEPGEVKAEDNGDAADGEKAPEASREPEEEATSGEEESTKEEKKEE
ncbi:MAG TPA: DUF4342 domain-containing protein [Candidatus Copromorpha excrementigallinarum]|uniref:DUF4342 domain-containing protein n=1 Tax=Candidatus Allocopromorpha excrementigallinarum TaxID=2840742 RepID=A0A9D1L5V4_9FIRM|nr:DUF4342 domain-containing protein [Candidatus Copromorpha excrementigallinarum]